MASDRGPRRRIATNIYEDGIRRYGIAKTGRCRREKTFAIETPLREIREWIEDTRRGFRRHRATIQRRFGTLGQDVAAYLATLPRGGLKRNRTADLGAWVLVLGDCRRAQLTSERLQIVVRQWIEAGVAANTLKHRRRALAQLLEALDGPEAGRIVRALRLPREPQPQPRGADVVVLAAILSTIGTMRPLRSGPGGRHIMSKAQARLEMMLATGITPISLQRLQPHAISLEHATITLPPRSKGAGAAAVTLPLFPPGVDACRAWLRAFAWGPFDTRALSLCFRRAVRRYKATELAAGRTPAIPADLKMYDLRHSFLSWLWEQTSDLTIVQEYGQHADLETTRRYVQRVVGARIQTAVAEVTARMVGSTGWIATPSNRDIIKRIK